MPVTGDVTLYNQIQQEIADRAAATAADAVTDAAAAGGFAKLSRQTFSNAAVTILPGSTVVAQIGTMSAPRVATLPAASAVAAGTVILVVDEAGSVGATNTVTITAAGTDSIGAGTTKVINTAYGSARVVCDGTAKWTVV